MCPCKEPPKYYSPLQKILQNCIQFFPIFHDKIERFDGYSVRFSLTFRAWLFSVFFFLSQETLFRGKKDRWFLYPSQACYKNSSVHYVPKRKMYRIHIFFACSKASKLFMSDFPSLRQLSALWKMQPLYL